VHVPQKLPVVLSREEVARLIAAAPNLKDQTALSVAYGTGLRVSEVIVAEGHRHRQQAHGAAVEQGKGRKDRYAMLSPVLLERLRAWWRLAHAQGKMLPDGWLFPGLNPVDPLTARQLNRAVHSAAEPPRSTTRVHAHAAPQLCHTPAGAEGRHPVIQVMLGHKKLETTVVYTHVATEILREVVSPLEAMQPA
jgi:integrase/recombinase XerD